MTISQILSLRKDMSSIYSDFIEFFISSIVGKNYYKENRCFKLLSEFTTVSDEAMAILTYENNIKTWKDMASKNITKNSNVGRKYTNGGLLQGRKASSCRFHGWSSCGIAWFNELYSIVESD